MRKSQFISAAMLKIFVSHQELSTFHHSQEQSGIINFPHLDRLKQKSPRCLTPLALSAARHLTINFRTLSGDPDAWRDPLSPADRCAMSERERTITVKIILIRISAKLLYDTKKKQREGEEKQKAANWIKGMVIDWTCDAHEPWCLLKQKT